MDRHRHLTLVTRNARHFSATGVALLNPFSEVPAP
jgi:predicted nucleic acid-binding protein